VLLVAVLVLVLLLLAWVQPQCPAVPLCLACLT
jgi:hypothetical protein